MLGYGIDHRSALLGERLADARADRERRADAMAARLRELGCAIDPAPIEARKAAGKPVGRPHLAAAVLAHPANAARLAEEGHDDVSSFIPAYLIQGKRRLRGAHAPDRRGGDRRGSTTPPAWRSGRTRSGTSRTRTRCWRRSTATAPRGWTGSRRSTSPTPSSRRCWWPTAAPSSGCSRPGSSDYHGPDHRLFARFRGVRPVRARAQPGADRLRHARGAGARDGRAVRVADGAVRARASRRSGAWRRGSCATSGTAWRCSTGTTSGRTCRRTWASRARTATRTWPGSPGCPTC